MIEIGKVPAGTRLTEEELREIFRAYKERAIVANKVWEAEREEAERFFDGTQWPEGVWVASKGERPALTFNRIPPRVEPDYLSATRDIARSG